MQDTRIAKETQRRPPRLDLVHTGSAILGDLPFEMELQFFIERRTGSVAPEERASHHSHAIEVTHRSSSSAFLHYQVDRAG